MLVGGRYDQQPEGLHISNVTSSDEGDYYCQAVVESGGMFKEQRLTLKLLGILPVCHINTTTNLQILLCSSVPCFFSFVTLASNVVCHTSLQSSSIRVCAKIEIR